MSCHGGSRAIFDRYNINYRHLSLYTAVCTSLTMFNVFSFLRWTPPCQADARRLQESSTDERAPDAVACREVDPILRTGVRHS